MTIPTNCVYFPFQAIDSHKLMANIHDDQSQADVSIEELSGDYIQMVKAAQEVLARRRSVLG